MRALDQATDEELFRLAADDELAFVALYRRHAQALLGFAARRSDNAEAAADACAETFAVLTHAILSRRDPPASVSGWLYATLRNKLVDAQRRGQAEVRARSRLGMPRLELTDAGIAAVERAGTDVHVTAALAELPDAQREAIQARFVNENTYEAIARDQGVSNATVRQRVTRGLSKLRTTIERPQ